MRKEIMMRILKKTSVLFLSVLLLFILCESVLAEENAIPEDVLSYAETDGMETFRETAGMLGLPKSVNLKTLQMGEGFRVEQLNVSETAASLQECRSSLAYYYFVVETEEQTPVSSFQIYVANNGSLSSGGGAESVVFVRAVQKMRELIRKAGEKGDVSVSMYGRDYFLHYSFRGDERVIYVTAPIFFNEDYLKVTDYRELPTGEEVLSEIRRNQEEIKAAMEANGGQLVYGGLDLNLSLHEKPFPTWTLAVGGTIATMLIVGGVMIFFRLRRKPKSN